MNKIVLAVLALLIAAASTNSSAETEHLLPAMQVDSTDTIYFDLGKIEILGATANFPVYIASDDTINALDFSFRYDLDSIEYDSIVELTNYIQSFYFYNTNDSTLRYTSFSMQPYSKDTALLNVQFDLNMQSTLFTSDFYELKGYLNGTECAIEFVTSTSGVSEINHALPLGVYPNPAASTLYIHTKPGALISIISASGTTISEIKATGSLLNSIDIDGLTPGIYMVRVTDGISSSVQKLTKL